MKTKTMITVLLTSMVLTACSSNTNNGSSAGSRKTTGDIMKGQYGSNTKHKPENFRKNTGGKWNVSPAHTPNYSDYTRTEAKELNGIFPRLPNPDLCMYVYPHLSGEKATIPGYTSCFSMYDKNEYALPGEMLATWQHKR